MPQTPEEQDETKEEDEDIDDHDPDEKKEDTGAKENSDDKDDDVAMPATHHRTWAQDPKLICPRCLKASSKRNLQLLTAKGFATVTCRLQEGGCGIRSSALHWDCRCESGLRWYKCPTHCLQQMVVAHRQNRKANQSAAASNRSNSDIIPTLATGSTKQLAGNSRKVARPTTLIRPQNAAHGIADEATEMVRPVALVATLCPKLALKFPQRFVMSDNPSSSSQATSVVDTEL